MILKERVMTAESFLNKNLQKFSIIDIALIKWVYFVLSLMVFHFYPSLSHLDWWFYGALMLIAILPLWVHLFSQKGSYFDKVRTYLKTNTSSNQVLLFFACFFAALMIGVLCPILVTFKWWIYVIVIIVLAIKPLTVSWIW